MGRSRPLFVYFRSFLITIYRIQIEKTQMVCLGFKTCGCRMVGTDKTTELWRLPSSRDFLNHALSCEVQIVVYTTISMDNLHLNSCSPFLLFNGFPRLVQQRVRNEPVYEDVLPELGLAVVQVIRKMLKLNRIAKVPKLLGLLNQRIHYNFMVN